MARKAKKIEYFEEPEVLVEVLPEETNTDNKKIVPIVLDARQASEYAELQTVSAKIRYLANENFERRQIAAYTGKKYQHVRNVLTTPLKKVGMK